MSPKKICYLILFYWISLGNKKKIEIKCILQNRWILFSDLFFTFTNFSYSHSGFFIGHFSCTEYFKPKYTHQFSLWRIYSWMWALNGLTHRSLRAHLVSRATWNTNSLDWFTMFHQYYQRSGILFVINSNFWYCFFGRKNTVV